MEPITVIKQETISDEDLKFYFPSFTSESTSANIERYKCTAPIERYKCGCCPFTTPFLLWSKQHVCNKRASELLEYSCQHCCFSTNSVVIYLKHTIDVCPESQWFYCDQCSFKTTSDRNLQNHKKNKHSNGEDIQWFRCTMCVYKAKWKKNITSHMEAVHSNKLYFNCPECHYVTKRKQDLEIHVSATHCPITGPSWLQCELCPFRTLTSVGLKRHMLGIHYDQSQSFSCGYCSFVTKRKDSLKRHREDQHKIYISKPVNDQFVACDYCKFKTKRKENLQKHYQRKHSSNLTAKMKVCKSIQQEVDSSNYKWYSCDQCPFSATLERSLKIHKQSHNKAQQELFFRCAFCPLKTTRKDSLKRHVRETHRNELQESCLLGEEGIMQVELGLGTDKLF